MIDDLAFLTALRGPHGQDPNWSDIQHLLELAQSGDLIHVDEARDYVKRIGDEIWASVDCDTPSYSEWRDADADALRDPSPTHDDAHPEGRA